MHTQRRKQAGLEVAAPPMKSGVLAVLVVRSTAPESYSTKNLCSIIALLMQQEGSGGWSAAAMSTSRVWLENKSPQTMELPAVLSTEQDEGS